jgi:hypothetical protein
MEIPGLGYKGSKRELARQEVLDPFSYPCFHGISIPFIHPSQNQRIVIN